MCLFQMALISRANNEKPSNNRFGGNWRTEAAKYATYLGGLGAMLGLGYGGYQKYQDYKNIKDLATGIYQTAQIPKEIYWGAVSGMIENPKGFSIPGGFPK